MIESGPVLTSGEFQRFRALAYQEFGIDLPEGKEQLVASRLGKPMRTLSLDSFEKYYKHVVEDRTGEALIGLADALTTNHTSFFREPAHFEFLRKIIVPHLRARDKIDIWSAGCSSGEEPYSIAFCIFDELGWTGLSKTNILATDLSTRVLEVARNAIYPSERFQGLSPETLRRYVLRGEREWKHHYRVKKPLRDAVEFRRFNLMNHRSEVGLFPLIFCRNVMIYFDRPTQQALIHRLAACLEPGGYFFIGHAESLGGIDTPLDYVQPAIYRKPECGGSARGRKNK